MNANRVLLLTLSERTSAKGNAYLSGWLGKASVVAFRGEDDKHGNPTWDVFVSTPEPTPEQRQTGATEANVSQPPEQRNERGRAFHSGAPAKGSASPVARGDGWRGSQYRRPANGARRAPVGDGGAFHEDGLENIGRTR